MMPGNQLEPDRFVPGAAYIRYSSDMQNDSFSLDAQLRQIKIRAEHDGVQTVKIFSDSATSAYTKKHRPGITAMLDAARRSEYRFLYVHKVDRLARRLEWTLEIVRELHSLNITLRAVEQNFDLSTPEGKLFFHLLSSLGEFYSDNLSKETLKGKRKRAFQGYHNGWLPWGYDSVQQDKHKIAIPNPGLATIIQEMFEMYATGIYSDQQIAQWLNGQGFRTTRGRIFSKDGVREMLQNPFYKGYVRYRGSFQKGKPYRGIEGQIERGVHEPIVSEELWDRCIHARSNRRKIIDTRQITRRIYLANGIIVCGECGRRLRSQSARYARYYREASRHNGFDDCRLAGMSIRADKIDNQIGELIAQLKLPDDWQAALKEIVLNAGESSFNPESEKHKIKSELRLLREMKRRNLYDGEEYLFWREVDTLQEQLRALEQIPQPSINRAAEILLSISEAWSCATLEEQRELVQMLFDEIGCDLEQGRIIWVKPRPGFENLFCLLNCFEPAECGRFDICDIWESKS